MSFADCKNIETNKSAVPLYLAGIRQKDPAHLFMQLTPAYVPRYANVSDPREPKLKSASENGLHRVCSGTSFTQSAPSACTDRRLSSGRPMRYFFPSPHLWDIRGNCTTVGKCVSSVFRTSALCLSFVALWKWKLTFHFTPKLCD